MNTSIEEREAIVELTSKTAFKAMLSTIPVIGMILSDVLFEYRGKVKQDRINKFVAILHESFITSNPLIDRHELKSDEIGDLFENVLKKVALTRSQQKLQAFKNILLRGFASKEHIDYCELFTELLSQLQEKQIEISSAHFNTFDHNEVTVSNEHSLSQELQNTRMDVERQKDRGDGNLIYALKKKEDELKDKLSKIREIVESSKHVRTAAFYNIKQPEYNFYVQDLYNKSLFYDAGIGVQANAFEIMQVTDFGKQFLEFIKEDKRL
jgi:hypothetical protein